MPGCCAVGCSNRSENGFKIYSIPSGKNDQIRKKIWLSRIKRENFEPKKSTGLCECHFESSQFEKNIPKKLKPNAVPTLFAHIPQKAKRKSPRKRRKSGSPAPTQSKKLKAAEDIESLRDVSTRSANIAVQLDLDNSQVEPSDLDETPRQSCEKLQTDETVSCLKRKIQALQKTVQKLQFEKDCLETKYQGIFNSDQVRYLELGKNAHVTWTDTTVRKAMQIRFACGPTGYDVLLHHGLPLPSDRTLRRRLQPVSFSSGILEEVFIMLADKVQSLAKEETSVSLTLDEMAIQPSLDFDCRSGGILGLPTVHNSDGKLCEDVLATHALVFMLHGLSTPWKQAIAYEFTGNSCSAARVKDIILNIILKAHEIGLNVKSVTMDMGGGNQAVLREFGIHCKRVGDVQNTIPHPVSNEEKLYFFADFPHLLKNLRNHITRGQIIYLPKKTVLKFNLPCAEVSVSVIKQLLDIDAKNNLKLVPKLKESYVNLCHFEKMKVAPAQALLSRQTAAAIRILVDRKYLTNNALTTAWFFEQVGTWYDIVTSRSNRTALSYHSLKKLNSAIAFLTDFIVLIRNVHIGSEKAAWKPVQKGITISTTSALLLKDVLLDQEKFKFICLGRFTQDGLENLFSMVRFKNPVPTALEFKNALRIITVSQLFKTNTKGSYTVDDNVQLISDLPVKTQSNSFAPIATTNEKLELTEIEMMSLYNLAGYCLKSFSRLNSNCQDCLCFSTTNDRSAISDFTMEACYTVNSLTFVSKPVFELFKLAERVILDLGENVIKSDSVIPRLVNETENRYKGIKFPECHGLFKKLLRSYFRVRLFSFLRTKKNELKAKRSTSYMQEAESSRRMAMHAKIK